MNLKIGRKYKARNGQTVLISNGLPPVNGKRLGWNGIYFGKIAGVDERFTFEGKHWNYHSQYSPWGYQELNEPEFDLIEEVK